MPYKNLVRGRQNFEQQELERDIQTIEQDPDWEESWEKRDNKVRQLKEHQLAKKQAALDKIKANKEKRNGRISTSSHESASPTSPDIKPGDNDAPVSPSTKINDNTNQINLAAGNKSSSSSLASSIHQENEPKPSTTASFNKRDSTDEEIDLPKPKPLNVYRDPQSRRAPTKYDIKFARFQRASQHRRDHIANKKAMLMKQAAERAARPVATVEDCLDENGQYRGTAGLSAILKRKEVLKGKSVEDIAVTNDTTTTAITKKRFRKDDGQVVAKVGVNTSGATNSAQVLSRKPAISVDAAKGTRKFAEPTPPSSKLSSTTTKAGDKMNSAAGIAPSLPNKTGPNAAPDNRPRPIAKAVGPSAKAAKLNGLPFAKNTTSGPIDYQAMVNKSLFGPLYDNIKGKKVGTDIQPNKKRQASSDEDLPQAKRQAVTAPGALKNRKYACFVNAVIHLLQSMPEVVAALPMSEVGLLDRLGISKQDLDMVGSTRSGAAAMQRLEKTLRALNESGDIDLTTCLSHILSEVAQGAGKEINAQLVLSMSGILFKNLEGQPIDGEHQEDAHGYLQSILQKVAEERSESGIRQLFDMTLDTKMVCRQCGEAKTLHDTDLTISFPSHGSSASVQELLGHALADRSKFDDLVCSACKSKAGWSRAEGWNQKRFSIAPQYLQIPVARQGIDKHGAVKKVTTPLRLSTSPITVPMEDGTSARYELVASIHHQSDNDKAGHYYTIRKIGQQWFDCDDLSIGSGVRPVETVFVEKNARAKNASLLLFKKVE